MLAKDGLNLTSNETATQLTQYQALSTKRQHTSYCKIMMLLRITCSLIFMKLL